MQKITHGVGEVMLRVMRNFCSIYESMVKYEVML